MKKFLQMALCLSVVGLVFVGCQATRAGYETAPYRVIRKEGQVEVREYPTMRMAETTMGGDDFMRLFHYISRDNASEQKIAMTTPVFMTDVGTGKPKMAFVLPEKLSQPPAPKNQQVAVRETSPGTYAVLRFKGRQQDPSGKAATQLRTWLSTNNVPVLGEPMFAYFDPPWIPGYFRRNEVMIRILPTAQTTGH